MKKKTVRLLTIIIILYISFVSIDCIRLKNSEAGTKPLITLNLVDYENGNKYIGLGYSIKYYTKIKKLTSDNENQLMERGYGAEFRLFDSIVIWSMIEYKAI